VDEKQLGHRRPSAFIASVRADFKAGRCDARSASARLEIRRSQRYALRPRGLTNPAVFSPRPSGGGHAAPWPPPAAEFAREFLPHGRPLNFARLADELVSVLPATAARRARR
jgi:hypothetical protein